MPASSTCQGGLEFGRLRLPPSASRTLASRSRWRLMSHLHHPAQPRRPPCRRHLSNRVTEAGEQQCTLSFLPNCTCLPRCCTSSYPCWLGTRKRCPPKAAKSCLKLQHCCTEGTAAHDESCLRTHAASRHEDARLQDVPLSIRNKAARFWRLAMALP